MHRISRTLWLLPLVTALVVALAASPTLATATITASVTLSDPSGLDTSDPYSPHGAWVDTNLGFTASGTYSLDNATEQEVANGDASVQTFYYWTYDSAKLVSGGGDQDTSLTITYPSDTCSAAYYTVMVSYNVIVTYKDPNTPPDMGGNSDSKQVRVKKISVMANSNNYSICAGAKATPPHQATITATVTDGWGTGQSGKSVSFTADHAYYQAAPTFNPSNGSTDTNGNVQTTLTSGDGEVSGTVKATCQQVEGDCPVSFGAPNMGFQFVDPQTGDPVWWLIADGQSQAKVILTETYNNAAVAQHSISWEFMFTQASDGSSDYTGTGQSPYGSIDSTSGTTDSNGQCSTIYTIGTIGGMIYFQATDNSVYHH